MSLYRRDGRQRKESAPAFAEARAIKLARDAEAREQWRGPTLHDYALRWVARHAGSGHDTVREPTTPGHDVRLAVRNLGPSEGFTRI